LGDESTSIGKSIIGVKAPATIAIVDAKRKHVRQSKSRTGERVQDTWVTLHKGGSVFAI
jgi:hypothetical protein